MGLILLIGIVGGICGMGLVCMRSKTPRRFSTQLILSRADFEVTNVKEYNKQIGNLWIIYGLLMGIFVTPLLIWRVQWGLAFFLIGAMVTGLVFNRLNAKLEEKYKKEKKR
ncbi:hypothetical protein ABXS75_15100 [Roseburia hominis]